MGRRKKIRTEKQSGPLRHSDRIRNWFVYNDPLKTELELDYIDKYFQAKYWPSLAERFLYRDGEQLPEMTNAFFAMTQYDSIRSAEAEAKQQQQRQK